MNVRVIRYVSLLVFVAMPFFATNGSPTSDEPMPQVIAGMNARSSLFLTASRVIGPDGQVRRDAPLSSLAQRNLTDFLALPRVDGCIHVGEVYLDYVNAPNRRGLASAIATADFVVEAEVVKASFGFMEGVPGQLLRLRTESLLKGASGQRRREYYIFVPVADFAVAGIRFCKTDQRYGSAPEIGDTVFVFADDHFVTDGFVNVIDEKGFVRASPDGRVVLPRSFHAGAAQSITADDVRRAVREAEHQLPEAKQ